LKKTTRNQRDNRGCSHCEEILQERESAT
jgi:hypothetical protein